MDPELARAVRAWAADESRVQQSLLSRGYQGAVYLFSHGPDGAPVRYVLKRAVPGFFSGWLHRWLLRREARAYLQLEGIAGVPRSEGLLDGTWLVLEYVEAKSLKLARDCLPEPEHFYERLHAVIRACHSAGVAHGDLKRKDNILVTPAGQPYLIDFGTAVMRDGAWLERRLFPLVCRIDHNAWVKAKYRKRLDQVSVEDSVWHRPSLAERGFRWLQRGWRLVTMRRPRRRRRRAQANRGNDRNA